MADINDGKALRAARRLAGRSGGYVPVTRGSALAYPGSLPFEVLGFIGPHGPSPRSVDYKRKEKDRRRRKLARARRRQCRR